MVYVHIKDCNQIFADAHLLIDDITSFFRQGREKNPLFWVKKIFGVKQLIQPGNTARC